MEPERGAPEWFADLIERIHNENYVLSEVDLDGLTYSPETAAAIFKAHAHTERPVTLSGTVDGDLTVSVPRIEGDLIVRCNINGSLTVGLVHYVQGEDAPTIGGSINIYGDIKGDLHIQGFVGRDVSIQRGTIGGNFTIGGNIRRGGDAATVGGDVGAFGRIVGGVNIAGNVAGSLHMSSDIGGDLRAERVCRVEGDRIILAGTRCAGDTSLQIAWVNTSPVLDLTGYRSVGRFVLAPTMANSSHVTLASVANAWFSNPAIIGDRVDISRCDFRQTIGLDHLELVGADLFPPKVKELATRPAPVWPGMPPTRVPPLERASINRQLRTNLENRNNRPATNRFYRGEMNARLEHAALTRPWYRRLFSDWALLRGYKLISDYGLSICRPIVTALVLAWVFTAGFSIHGLDVDPAVPQCASVNPAPGCEHVQLISTGIGDFYGLLRTFVFTLRSMVSFLSPPDAQLGPWGQLLQIVVRFIGPSLIALTLLAIRNRVAR